jgi:hypothetical protein
MSRGRATEGVAPYPAARFDPVGDVTLEELRIELTYPLDDIADRFFRDANRADTQPQRHICPLRTIDRPADARRAHGACRRSLRG